MIELGYAPTVRSSPVPLYMRGWDGLGQDFYSGADAASIVPEQVIDVSALTPPDFGAPSFSSSPGIFAPTDPSLQPLIDSGMSPDAAGLLADAASSGAITNAQFQQAIASKMSSTDLENLILGAGTFASVARPPSSSPTSQIVRSATDFAKAAAAHNQPNLGPGASPRVASTPTTPSVFTGKTAIAGMVIPNIALLGVAAVILLAATKGGR